MLMPLESSPQDAGAVDLFALPRERSCADDHVQAKRLEAMEGLFFAVRDNLGVLFWMRVLSFTGSTPGSAAMASATLTALRIVSRDHSMHKRLAANVNHVRRILQLRNCRQGKNQSDPGSLPRQSKNRKNASAGPFREGAVYPSLIRYPGAPQAEFFSICDFEPPQPQATGRSCNGDPNDR